MIYNDWTQDAIRKSDAWPQDAIRQIYDGPQNAPFRKIDRQESR
jgi:hypothetical protein